MARRGVMLAKPFEERFLSRWPERFYAQPKYNGRRARAIAPQGKYAVLSSEANTLPSCRHIEAQLDECFKHYPTKPTFDGELYVHGYSIQHLGSLISVRNNITDESQAIEFHIFDMIDSTSTQQERIFMLDMLKDRIELRKNLRVSPYWNITKDEVADTLNSLLKDKYEGIILRNPTALYTSVRSSNMLKLKPRFQDSYEILSAFEAISVEGMHKQTLGGLTVRSKSGDIFRTGAGCFSHEQRDVIWSMWLKTPELLKGQFATVKYQELSERKIPLQPILMSITNVSMED